jgi:hypothetical protein
LPGERAAAAAVAAPPAPAREDAPLPPEVEAIAAFQEAPVAEPVAPPAAPAPTPRRESDRGGLRFGDEVVRRELDDEDAPRGGGGGRRGRRGGSAAQGAAERARPGAQPRGRGGRFEIDEEEIEEGLAELHGEQFDFGFEDEEDDEE